MEVQKVPLRSSYIFHKKGQTLKWLEFAIFLRYSEFFHHSGWGGGRSWGHGPGRLPRTRTSLERGICHGDSWHEYRGISGDMPRALDYSCVLYLEPNFYLWAFPSKNKVHKDFSTSSGWPVSLWNECDKIWGYQEKLSTTIMSEWDFQKATQKRRQVVDTL